jgi:serine/threonine protein kinase
VRWGKGWVGPYRLLRPHGDCEKGELFAATREGAVGFQKPVAVWRVQVSGRHEARFLDAVVQEAKRAALLSHANIAHVLDLGVCEGACFVATELCPGASLEILLRSVGTLRWPAVAAIGKGAARALHYAHLRRDSNGELLRLIHGRLSPRRIVMGAAGAIKITGFGTSRAWLALDVYRAPEEERSEPIDGRADVFSLGRILDRCLGCGAAPPALEHAIERATEPYQEHRWTAGELEAELTEILHRSGQPEDELGLSALSTLPSPQSKIDASGLADLLGL